MKEEFEIRNLITKIKTELEKLPDDGSKYTTRMAMLCEIHRLEWVLSPSNTQAPKGGA